MELYGARVTLTDNSAPTLSVGGPLLAATAGTARARR